MFTGTGTALATPFCTDGSLDEPTLRSLVQRQLDAGINFLVPCGTTGESPTLSHAEHLRVVEITLELAKGKVPVLAGAGGYNTSEATPPRQRVRSSRGGFSRARVSGKAHSGEADQQHRPSRGLGNGLLHPLSP